MYEDAYQPIPKDRPSGSHDGPPSMARWLRRGSPRGVRTVVGCIGVLIVLCLVIGSLRSASYRYSPVEPWTVPSTSLNFDHPTVLARGAFCLEKE